MADRLISRDEARELATKWKTSDTSPLGRFARKLTISAGILTECRGIYAAPLAQAEREEALALGRYLAARAFEDAARKQARLSR